MARPRWDDTGLYSHPMAQRITIAVNQPDVNLHNLVNSRGARDVHEIIAMNWNGDTERLQLVDMALRYRHDIGTSIMAHP